MASPYDYMMQSLLQNRQSVTDAKQARVAEEAAEKKKRFDPNFEEFDPDLYEVVDADTLQNRRTGESIRVQGQPGTSINSFEPYAQSYLKDPERFRHHREAYGKLYGRDPDNVSIEDLTNLGQVQSNRLKANLEKLRGVGMQRTGIAPDGVRTLAQFDDESVFQQAKDLTGNASYFAPSNYQQRARDIFSGEYQGIVPPRDRSIARALGGDAAANLLIGAGRMATDLAQGAAVIGQVNNEGVDKFFTRTRDRLDDLKKSLTSPAQQFRERMDQKEQALQPEIFELRKQKALKEGKTETEASISAGIDEYQDRIGYLLENPGRILDATLESLPYMIGVGAVGRTAVNAAIRGLDKKILAEVTAAGGTEAQGLMSAQKFATSKAGREYLKEVSDQVGIATVGVTEGLSNSSDVYNSIVSMTESEASQSEEYRNLRAEGKSHREAVKELASKAFATTLVTNTLLAGAASAVTGAGGLEARLFTARAGIRELAEKKAAKAPEGILKRSLKSVGRGAGYLAGPGLREAAEESIQSGGGEFLSQLAQYKATGKPIGPGIGAATAEGGLVGLASGGVLGGGTDVLKLFGDAGRKTLRNAAASQAATATRPLASVVNPPPGPGGSGGGAAAAEQPARTADYDPLKSYDEAVSTLSEKVRANDPDNPPSYDDYEAVSDHFYAMKNSGIKMSPAQEEFHSVIKEEYNRVLSGNVGQLTDEQLANPTPEVTELINRAAMQKAISAADRERMPEKFKKLIEQHEEIGALEEELTDNITNRSELEAAVTKGGKKTLNSVNEEKLGSGINEKGQPGIQRIKRELSNLMATPGVDRNHPKFKKLAAELNTLMTTQRARLKDLRTVVKRKKGSVQFKYIAPRADGTGGSKLLLEKMEHEQAIMESIFKGLSKQYKDWTGSQSPVDEAAQQPAKPKTVPAPQPAATTAKPAPEPEAEPATTTTSEKADQDTEADSRPDKDEAAPDTRTEAKTEKPAAKEVKPGINIVSPYRGRVTTVLGGALTNVTYKKYPIADVPGLKKPAAGSNHGMSAEGWYQANKTGDLAQDMAMMQQVIEAKFKQYPSMVKAITDHGGVAWLESSRHEIGIKNSRWEGKGRDSNFILALIGAYEAATGTAAPKPVAPAPVETPAPAPTPEPTPAPAPAPETPAEQAVVELDPNAPFKLNADQEKAYEGAVLFLNSKDNTFSIIGSAGTGKTTLVKEILATLKKNKDPRKVVLTAPTHRANAVTRSKNKRQSVATLHSLLGLVPSMDLENFNAKDIKFDKNRSNKDLMPHSGIVIVDESSMINDSLFKFLTETAAASNTKLIFLGDQAQLGPVKQATDSKALSSTDSQAILNQVMRAKNSMLLNESVAVRKTGDFTNDTAMVGNNGVAFTNSATKFLDKAIKFFKSEAFKENPLLVRVLAFRNATVTAYNKAIRQALHGENAAPYVAGELLMGYNAFGEAAGESGLTTVANGIDYLVEKVGNAYMGNLFGVPVEVIPITIRDVYELGSSKVVNIVSPTTSQEVINLIATNIHKLVDIGYTGTPNWKKFYAEKDKLALSFDIPKIGSTRNETWLNKTIDYGYAHTIHKSQGGTYKYVMVDARDVKAARSEKEKSRLRYVGLTRAEQGSFVLTDEKITVNPQTKSAAATAVAAPAPAPIEPKPAPEPEPIPAPPPAVEEEEFEEIEGEDEFEEETGPGPEPIPGLDEDEFEDIGEVETEPEVTTEEPAAPVPPVTPAPPPAPKPWAELTETEQQDRARRLVDARRLRDYIAEGVGNNTDYILVSQKDNTTFQKLVEEGMDPGTAIETVINNYIEPDPAHRNARVQSNVDEATQATAVQAAKLLNEGKEKPKAKGWPARWASLKDRGVLGTILDQLRKKQLPTALDQAMRLRTQEVNSLFGALPDVMAVISDPGALRNLIDELKLSPREGRALIAFAYFYPRFEKAFKAHHRKLQTNKNWTANMLREYPLYYFEDENGNMDPNVIGAMALEVMLWWATSGPQTIYNDDDAIRAMLARRETDSIHPDERNILQLAGIARNRVANDLGPAIGKHLNIAKLEDVKIDPLFADRVITDLGGTAVGVMLHMKLMKDTKNLLGTQVSKSWYENALKNKTGTLTAAEIRAADAALNHPDNKKRTEPTVNFIRNNSTHAFENGREIRRDLSTSLREALEGGMDVFARLFDVDTRVKTPVFRKPTAAPTKISGALGNIAKIMQERMLSASQRVWTANRSPISLVLRFEEETLLGMTDDYVPEDQIESTLHKTNWDAARGRNRGLVRDLKAALDWEREYGTKPFYFLYRMISSGRVYIDSNVINPLQSKIHRYLFAMKEWQQTLSTKPEDQMTADELISFENFLISVGSGFGVKIGRLTREATLQQTRDILKSQEMTNALAVLNREGKITRPEDLDTLGVFLKTSAKHGGEGFHTLAALNAWHTYTKAAPNSTINISLPLEIDGVTNGFIGLKLQLVAEPYNEEMLEQLRGGALTFKGDPHKNFAEFLAAGGMDNYQSVAVTAGNHLVAMTMGRFPSNVKDTIGNYIRSRMSEIDSNDLAPSIEEIVGSIGRQWAKNPVTVVAYGSSIRSVMNAIVESSLQKFYDNLAAAALDKNNPAQAVADVLNKAYGIVEIAFRASQKPSERNNPLAKDQIYKFDAVSVQEYAKLKQEGDIGKFARNFTFLERDLKLFTNGIVSTYGAALTLALESKMKSFEALRSKLNHANMYMNMIFVKDFMRRLKTLEENTGGLLGPKERRQILVDMWKEGVVPSAAMALNEPGKLNENMELTSYGSGYVESDAGAVRTYFDEALGVIERAFEGVEGKWIGPQTHASITHQIATTLPNTDVGVAAIPALIHGIDGTNNSHAWGNYPVLNGHDAAFGNPDQMDEIARGNNAELIRIHSIYSIPDAIMDAVARMQFLMRHTDSRLSVEDKNTIRNDFVTHLKQFAYIPRDLSVPNEQIITTFLSSLLRDVNQVAENKKALLGHVAYSAHFSKAGGEVLIQNLEETERNPSFTAKGQRTLEDFLNDFHKSLTGEDISQREADIGSLVTALKQEDADDNAIWLDYINQRQPSGRDLMHVIQAVLREVGSPAAETAALLHNMIANYIGDVMTEVVDFIPSPSGNPKGAFGKYLEGPHLVRVSRNAEMVVSTAIHELLHASNLRRLGTLQTENSERFNELLTKARTWAKTLAASTDDRMKELGNRIVKLENAPNKGPKHVISEYISYLLSKSQKDRTSRNYDLDLLVESTKEIPELSVLSVVRTLHGALADPRTGTVKLFSTGKSVDRALFEDKYTLLETDKIKQIFEDLKALEQGPLDADHQQMLDMVLQDLAIPGLTSLGYVLQQEVATDPEGTENIGEVEGDKVRLQAAGNKLSSNVDMSMQETALHEYLHPVFKTAINSNHFIRKEVARLYNLVKDKITVQHFLTDQSTGNTALDLQRAQERYDHIFNNPDKQHYHEFMAIGLTNMAFAKALQRLDNQDELNIPQKLNWSKGILRNLVEIARSIFQWISGQSRRTTGGTVHQAMYALAKTIIAVNQHELQKIQDIQQDKDKTVTDQVYRGFAKMDKVARDLADKMTEKLADTLNKNGGRKFNRNDPKILDFIGSAAHSAMSVKNRHVRAAYNEVYRSMGGKKNNFFFDMAREIMPWEGSIKNWIDMLMKSKTMVDRMRQQIIQNTGSYLEKSFDKANYLDQNRKRSITRVLFNTDAVSLTEGDNAISYRELSRMLNNPALFDAHKAKLYALLEQELRKDSGSRILPVFEKQMNSLASYMINSTVQAHNHLMNAHNIVNQLNLAEHYRVPLNDKEKIIDLVDKIVSLKALELVEDNDIRMSLDMVNHEIARTNVDTDDDGYHRLMGMLSNFKFTSREMLFNEQPIQMIKGYVYEIFDGDVNVEYVDDTIEERLRMEAKGMKLVARLPQDKLLAGKLPPKLLYKGLRGLAGYAKSVVSLNDMQHRGANLFETVNYQNRDARESLNNARNAAYKASKNQFDPNYTSPGAHMVPVFNNSGEIVDYRYMMSEANKRSILKKEDAFDKVLPRMFGSISEKTSSKDINSESAKLLYKEYIDLSNNPQYKFIEVGAATLKRDRNGNYIQDAYGNPVPDLAAREMWNLLPDSMQLELRKLFGGKHMYIRDDVYNLVLGFRKMSLSRLGENKETGQGSIWGKHSDIVFMAERHWQEVIQLVRVKIAALTPRVVIGNVASNTAILLSQGIPPEYIRAKHSEAVSAMRGYQRDIRARDELGHHIGSLQAQGKDTRRFESEYGRLQADIENSPVHELVEDGLFTSIVEEIGVTESSLRQRYLDKGVDVAKKFLPDPVIAGVQELYMLPGSKSYRTAMAVTQYSDFVARYTQVMWHTKDAPKEKRLEKQAAVHKAMANFIYYDLPLNPKMQYLTDTGFSMFPKFFLRIQPIVANIYSQNPAYAFGVLGLQAMLLPKPFNENIMSYGMGSGLTHKITFNPVAKVTETLDLTEPSLLQVVLNPFGL